MTQPKFQGFRQMYVFTMLAVLLQSTLWVITHTPDLKEGVTALLNLICGGLITQIGSVVASEFRSEKPQDRARATDVPGAATLSVTGAAGDTATATASTQGAKTP